MNLADTAVRNRTTTFALTLVLVMGGLIAFTTMGRLEDPEFTIKDAQVITPYPGATAQEVAEEVTEPVERAVQMMGQVDYIKSKSRPGLSILTVRVEDHYDKEKLPQVWDELRRKVGDMQGRLPPGAGPSVVNDDFGDVYGAFFTVYGDGFSYRDLKDYVEALERELLLVEDVAKVTLFGLQKEVIYVEISRARLARLGISENQIYSTLARKNTVVGSGTTDVGIERIRVVPKPGLGTVDDIGNTPIQGLLGSRQIFLKDVAKVYRDYEDPPSARMHFAGKRGIGVGISVRSGGNVVTMGEAVERRLRELKSQTPIGIEMGVVYWQSNYVSAAINSFVVSLLEALAIVIGVLLFTMGLKSGVLIGVILLLTVLGTFVPMKAQGIALERISLGALIIALGMLVDNAIVVTEGLQVRIEGGMDKRKAAFEVVGSTMWPLLGGTFVAILAFGALGFSQDATGEYCRSLFSVVTYSLLLSWLLAVTVTPLVGTMLFKPKAGAGDRDPYGGGIFRAYRGLLGTAMRFRWITVAILGMLLALGIKGFGMLDQSFFPDSTTPQFTVDYWTTEGTDLRQTERDISQIEEFILGSERVGSAGDEKGLAGVEAVASVIGRGAPRFMLTYQPEEPDTAYAQLIVEVDDYTRITDLVQEIETYIEANFPSALTYARRFVLGPGGGSKIEARFRGPEPAVLRALSDEAMAIMAADSQARDVRDDWREQVKVIRPILNETNAARAGLTRQEISQATQRTYGGRPIGLYRKGDTLIPIVARAPLEERENVTGMGDLQVRSPVARKTIPIRNFADGYEVVWEDNIIARRDRQPTITPQCNQAFGSASEVFARLRPQIEGIQLEPGYSLEWGGEYENSTKAQKGLARTFPLMIVLMILIVLTQFNALRQPLIIWLTVPLALVGVAAGLLLAGQPFGFMALLGLLSLIGMLIKNAIVLVDEIDSQIRTGAQRFRALLDASASRLRPVSLAAMTTVLGMIPLLPDAFFVSMAVTIMAGLTFATILTLVVVPVLYAIFFRIREDEPEPEAPPAEPA